MTQNIELPKEDSWTEKEVEQLAIEVAEIVHQTGEQLKDEKKQRTNYINENYL